VKRKPLTLEQRATALALQGKTIAKVALFPFADSNGGTVATDPVITFTDGTSLRFLTEETEFGEYGVALIYPAKPGRLL